MEEYRQIGETNYSVSNLGNVRNDKKGLILTPYDRKGYRTVKIEGRIVKVHRLVATDFIDNPEMKDNVDHINNNKTDNRVENLRFATTSENNSNKSMRKDNRSGHKGVYWVESRKLWRTQVKFECKTYNIGYFDNLADAVNARVRKATELYGEFLNECEKAI